MLVINQKSLGKPLGQRQKGVIARSILFRPGGRLACELARHGVILRVNNWIFCHGGLLPHHGKDSQVDLNISFRFSFGFDISYA